MRNKPLSHTIESQSPLSQIDKPNFTPYIINISGKKTATGKEEAKQTLTDDKIKELVLEQINKKIEDFKQDQNIKLIEFLGIFVAILSFVVIFINVSLSKLTFLQIAILLPLFAVVLLIFVIGIEVIIRGEKKSYFLWTLLIILIILLFIIYFFRNKLV